MFEVSNMSAVLTPSSFSPPATASVKPTIHDPLLTLEEFEEMDNRGFELVDGRLEEKGMGWKASEIGSRINADLSLYCRAKKLGKVFMSECGYRLISDRP